MARVYTRERHENKNTRFWATVESTYFMKYCQNPIVIYTKIVIFYEMFFTLSLLGWKKNWVISFLYMKKDFLNLYHFMLPSKFRTVLLLQFIYIPNKFHFAMK